MRQQLIKWLIEDIIPDAQQTKDPENSILKFAHDNNLAPAQVEMLGQLFNTAKTLSHLEKSSNRGASFPVLDVPAMVGKYLEVPAEKDIEGGIDEKRAEMSLPQCLAGWENLGSEQEIKIASNAAEEDPSIFAKERNWRNSKRETSILLTNAELAKQAAFDFQEKSRGVMEDIYSALRSDAALDFARIESDALFLHGLETKPIFEKLASYLLSRKWNVERGGINNTKRLIPEHGGVMDKIAALVDLHFMKEAADEASKDYMKQAGAAPAVTSGIDTATAAEPNEGRSSFKEKFEPAEISSGKTENEASKKDDSKKNNSNKGRGSKDSKPVESRSFFSPVNKVMDALGGKTYGLMEPVILKSLGSRDNDAQRTVDTDYINAKHLATLQRLMATDEVLGEADPEKVVSVYNTIREIAPNLAGDANVMRVALRSAIQHDGISPFDIKSFLDTESARQKKDYNEQLQDALRYKSHEMGNRSA